MPFLTQSVHSWSQTGDLLDIKQMCNPLHFGATQTSYRLYQMHYND